MLKRGIYDAKQYAENAAASTLLFRRTRFAYSLLRTSLPPSPADIERFEGVVQHVHLSGGVFRTTLARRFENLDLFLMPILAAHFPRETPLLAEDWAASACVTSAEWFPLLVESFPSARLIASDLYLHLIEIVLPSGESFIVEPTGAPLQYIRPPFVIPLNRRELPFFPVNRWLQTRAMKRLRQLKEHKGEGIPLIHPAALELSRTHPAFRIEEHSIFEARPEPSHVIRTMNILNRSYFKESQLTQSMRAVWQSLEMHGLWMVGRTIQERKEQTPALHHASVLEKTAEGFRLLERYGTPSEVEDLALALRM